MTIRKIVLALCLLAASLTAKAQKQRTVVDGDTGRGIANVSIKGKDFTIVTDSLGRFTLPENCKTLLFSHINYVSYLVNLNDLGDSVALFSNSTLLNEVTVLGKPTGKDPLAELNKGLRLNKTDAQLLSANPNGNLLGLLKYLIPKKWLKNTKKERSEHLKHILEEY
jgi:hypothetical protein